MIRLLSAAACAVTLLTPCAFTQASTPCTPLAGTVEDSTGALLPGAAVTLDGAAPVIADAAGHFRFACVPTGAHTLRATMHGFAESSLRTNAPHTGDVRFELSPSTQVSVSVQADDAEDMPNGGGTEGTTIAGKQLQALADDPDDLQRELQQMAAASGGSPGSTIISVDGFQGDSPLPPKDSIAYVNVSPDMFSAEYREPPFDGGRVEVYTKPGAKTFHGSLYGTNSSHWMNAQDPFSSSSGSIGKQRYGFDLSGPVYKQGSSFSISLEHRSIDEVGVVNAIVPGAGGAATQTTYTVPNPQRLWVGAARVDWQIDAKNIFAVAYQANVNHTVNNGVGGNTLLEAGYGNGSYDHTVRFSDFTTLSPHLVNEARVAVERRGETDVPNSNAPSQQVSGYFTAGGATLGNQRIRTWRTEFDEDFILNTKNHLIKAGLQGLYYSLDHNLTQNFNGTYIFGGYTAAAGGYVTPLAQYEAAQNSGGTATEFNNVAGNSSVKFSQTRIALFYEDTFKATPKLTFSYGLRYFLEVNPTAFNGVAPRVGLVYSPDKKSTWSLKAHFGLFNGQYSIGDADELYREDGVQRVTSLVYKPVYGSPFTGATPIHEYRTTSPGFNLPTYVIGEVSVSKELPKGFAATVQEVQIRFLTDARTLNVNSPLTASPNGPRPIAPNVNILQSRNDGSGVGNGTFMGLSNSKLKRVQFFMGAVHINIRENSNDELFSEPQSAYTDAGETARRNNGNSLWQMFGNVNFTLPYKLSLSGNGFASGGTPFNITTGVDNNGDGDFNDRPQYAAAGSVANGTTIFNTPMGLLTNSGAYVNAIPERPIPRNLGALPWNVHLDANIQRKWVLTHDAKAAHQQSVTANVRSANFLNHTNVNAEGSVLGSPQFLMPVAADTARRVEFGLRYSF